MPHDVTLSVAALAGLLSFLSPCVLPLVFRLILRYCPERPSKSRYPREARARRDHFLAAVLFIFGFFDGFRRSRRDSLGFRSGSARIFFRLRCLPGLRSS